MVVNRGRTRTLFDLPQAEAGANSIKVTPDSDLVDRFNRYRGRESEAAFEELVFRHTPMVERVCRSILGNSHDVQDAVQSTFLIFVMRSGSILCAGSASAWLHGVARRVALRSKSKNSRRQEFELQASDRLPQVVGLPSAGSDLCDDLGRLPEKYRLPLQLCYLEGMTHDEAAVHLKCPVGTVRSRMAKGRDLLRGALSLGALSSLCRGAKEEDTARASERMAAEPPDAERRKTSARTSDGGRTVRSDAPAKVPRAGSRTDTPPLFGRRHAAPTRREPVVWEGRRCS